MKVGEGKRWGWGGSRLPLSVMDIPSGTPQKKKKKIEKRKKRKIPFVRSFPLEIASCLGMNFHGRFFFLALVHPLA